MILYICDNFRMYEKYPNNYIPQYHQEPILILQWDSVHLDSEFEIKKFEKQGFTSFL